MSKDKYYKVLGVPKDADEKTIKKSYQKQALMWHPDRHSGKSDAEKKAAEEQFKLVSEAYDVLSDPKKRKIYDAFGEEGLKQGVPEEAAAGGGGMPGGMKFSGMPGGGYTFSSGDASRVFEQFFGSSDPFSGGGPFGGGPGFTRTFRSGHGGGGGGGGMPGMFSMFGGGGGFDDDDLSETTTGRSAAGKAPPVEFVFSVTLEELLKGTAKKFNVSRATKPGAAEEKKQFEVKVEPGYKPGTKVRFDNEGGYVSGYQQPADLVFILEQKPHPVFTRDNANIVMKKTLTLKEALLGTTFRATALDGSSLTIPVQGPSQLGREIRLTGQGLMDRKLKRQGDLIVKIDNIRMPSSLTDDQRKAVEQMF